MKELGGKFPLFFSGSLALILLWTALIIGTNAGPTELDAEGSETPQEGAEGSIEEQEDIDDLDEDDDVPTSRNANQRSSGRRCGVGRGRRCPRGSTCRRSCTAKCVARRANADCVEEGTNGCAEATKGDKPICNPQNLPNTITQCTPDDKADICIKSGSPCSEDENCCVTNKTEGGTNIGGCVSNVCDATCVDSSYRASCTPGDTTMCCGSRTAKNSIGICMKTSDGKGQCRECIPKDFPCDQYKNCCSDPDKPTLSGCYKGTCSDTCLIKKQPCTDNAECCGEKGKVPKDGICRIKPGSDETEKKCDVCTVNGQSCSKPEKCCSGNCADVGDEKKMCQA